jgi:hypothetical protein
MCCGNGAGWGEGDGRKLQEAGAAEPGRQQALSVERGCVSNWLVIRARPHKLAAANADSAARHMLRQPSRRPSGAFIVGARFDFGWLPECGRLVNMSVLTIDS